MSSFEYLWFLDLFTEFGSASGVMKEEIDRTHVQAVDHSGELPPWFCNFVSEALEFPAK
jgi:hypothetical protein